MRNFSLNKKIFFLVTTKVYFTIAFWKFTKRLIGQPSWFFETLCYFTLRQNSSQNKYFFFQKNSRTFFTDSFSKILLALKIGLGYFSFLYWSLWGIHTSKLVQIFVASSATYTYFTLSYSYRSEISNDKI